MSNASWFSAVRPSWFLAAFIALLLLPAALWAAPDPTYAALRGGAAGRPDGAGQRPGAGAGRLPVPVRLGGVPLPRAGRRAHGGRGVRGPRQLPAEPGDRERAAPARPLLRRRTRVSRRSPTSSTTWSCCSPTTPPRRSSTTRRRDRRARSAGRRRLRVATSSGSGRISGSTSTYACCEDVLNNPGADERRVHGPGRRQEVSRPRWRPWTPTAPRRWASSPAWAARTRSSSSPTPTAAASGTTATAGTRWTASARAPRSG